MTQNIRSSQFITTYGPGAILEGPDGPRIIPFPDIGLFNAGFNPIEISDQRMSRGLLQGARIFRLPSNAELGVSQNTPIYRTKPFPNWRICLNMANHNGNFYVLYNGYRGYTCPVCRNAVRTRNEPVRFVMACPQGHLDDINWNHFVHSNNRNPHTTWYRWYGGGGGLSNIELECPRCNHRSMNMGVAYEQEWSCNGRFPEREPLTSSIRNRNPSCNSPAKIVQRQASNLRIPELRTLFSISPRDTRLHTLLAKDPIFTAVVSNPPSSYQALETSLNNMVEAALLRLNIVSEILQCPWAEIETAIRDVRRAPPTTYKELLDDEFRVLVDASINGAPPVYRPVPHSPVIFEIDPNLVKTFDSKIGTLRVTPVLRLQTITVQISYRREVNTRIHASNVPVSFTFPNNPHQEWFPGTEFLGEGIFIILENNIPKNYNNSKESSSQRWNNTYRNSSTLEYENAAHLFRSDRREELHPLFVWWHTLSHLLIRAISEQSGYSSASIRERIYLDLGNSNMQGGILLYATQPGSEGTHGGLIALVHLFNHIIDVAIENLMTCSGGPLCLGNKFIKGKYNGAACPSCLLTSETSCEHRNMWLDRNVILENIL